MSGSIMPGSIIPHPTTPPSPNSRAKPITPIMMTIAQPPHDWFRWFRFSSSCITSSLRGPSVIETRDRIGGYPDQSHEEHTIKQRQAQGDRGGGSDRFQIEGMDPAL